MIPILQGLSYKVCSIISPKSFAFGLSVLVFRMRHYIATACCYATKTSEGLFTPMGFQNVMFSYRYVFIIEYIGFPNFLHRFRLDET